MISMNNNIRKALLINAVFIVLLSISCSSQYTNWERDVNKKNMNFSKVRYALHKTDTICIMGYLKSNTDIKGYPCKKGWIHFTEKWQPKLFCLYKKSTINHVQLPEGSWVLLNPGDEFFSVVFPLDTTIDNYKCKGGGGVTGIQTSFYNSGKLKEFFTDKNITIDNIECENGIRNPIKMYENGKLCSCKLNKDVTIDSITIKEGTLLQLDSLGKRINN